jgi:CDP-diacylglycerol--glycerol-3-phosphate 3-phosphatidyltransferase
VTGSIVSPGARQRVRDLATPIATALGRLGLSPNALTLIGFLGTCVAAWAAANQLWLVAGVLVLAFGIFDLFDGALARATGTASKFGAFLDSTFDRAGEAIVYIGIMAGCMDAGLLLGAFLAPVAMAAAFMVSYTRAKAESLGFAPGNGLAAIGLAPREVRIVILALGLLTAAGPSLDGLAISLGAVAALATLTTVQRVFHVAVQSREG